MATKKPNPFEKSKADKMEPKGMKEGSKREEKMDKKQMTKGAAPFVAMKRGGKVC